MRKHAVVPKPDASSFRLITVLVAHSLSMSSTMVFQTSKMGWRQLFRKARNRFRNRAALRRFLIEFLEDRRMMARQVSGTLTTNDTWSGTIEVIGDFSVASGTQLTIQPGTTIKAREGAFVNFQSGSQVTALGNSSSHITFTSTQDDSVGEDLTGASAGVPVSGQWESLYIDSSTVNLDFADIRFAGNVYQPGNNQGFVSSLQIRNGASPTVHHIGLADLDGFGLEIQDNTSPNLDAIAITRTRFASIYQALTATPTYSALSLNSTGGNFIQLQGGTVASNRSWNFANTPVHVVGDLAVADSKSLTLAPGTILKFATGASFYAAGTLVAEGSTSSPIVLTSTADDTAGGDSNGDGSATVPGPGQWEALYLKDSNSRLDHVEIRYAGNLYYAGHSSGHVSSLIVQDSSPSIKNTKLLSAENTAISITGSSQPRLELLNIVGSLGYAIYQDLAAVPDYSALTLSGNGSNSILIQAGSMSPSRRWNVGPIPIVINGDLSIPADTTLELAPGTILKMLEGANISASGTFKSSGTASQPVIITSVKDDTAGGDSNFDGAASTALPGAWESIYLYSDSSLLDHTEVRYAGNNYFPNHSSGRVSGVTIMAGNATISNSLITQAENVGIEARGTSKPYLRSTTIQQSGSYAIYQELS